MQANRLREISQRYSLRIKGKEDLRHALGHGHPRKTTTHPNLSGSQHTGANLHTEFLARYPNSLPGKTELP